MNSDSDALGPFGQKARSFVWAFLSAQGRALAAPSNEDSGPGQGLHRLPMGALTPRRQGALWEWTEQEHPLLSPAAVTCRCQMRPKRPWGPAPDLQIHQQCA